MKLYSSHHCDDSNKSRNGSCRILILCAYTLLCNCILIHCNCSVLAQQDSPPEQDDDRLVLSQRIIELTKTSAELSALAYEVNPSSEGYDEFHLYNNEPDQAIVAKKDGYCFGVFRGTTMTFDDWHQNLMLGLHEVCDRDPSNATVCCTTRIGFWKAYDTPFRLEMRQKIEDCAKTCSNKDECVVLTGHSQGGAIAGVASLVMVELNPYIITFGMPKTVSSDCPLLTSERCYRYINTKRVESGTVGLSYDPIPFMPGMGADPWGHMILLSRDNTGVAYIGLDAQDYFSPLDINGFEAHSMIGDDYHPGYLDRVQAIMNAYSSDDARIGGYPVRTNGYVAGSLCSSDKECESHHCGRETAFSWDRCIGQDCSLDIQCDTGRCDSGVCIPKLGSCKPCNENSDCLHGVCSAISFVCSGKGGLMDDECSCLINSDCHSGRCEGLKPRVCQTKLEGGAFCNENSDCKSNQCSWAFRCAPAKRGISAKEISAKMGVKKAYILDAENKSNPTIEIDIPQNMTNATTNEESAAITNDTIVIERSYHDIAAYPSSVNEPSTKSPKTGVFVFIVVILILAVGGGIYYWQMKRRQGYEQVPTGMTV